MPNASSPAKLTPRPPVISLAGRVALLQEPLPKEATEGITGNLPQEIKEIPMKWLMIYKHKGNSFACGIAERMKVVDISVVSNVDDPLKKDGQMTVDIEVTPGKWSGLRPKE